MNISEYGRMYEVEDGHWWYAGLHELVLGHIAREAKRLQRRLRIFDAGCGTGRLTALMSEYGEVEGCDVAEEAIHFCRERGMTSTFLADLNELQLASDTYDVITSIDVLYHSAIKSDIGVMARLHKALRPGGMIIINLAAHEFLRSSHDIAVHTRERYTMRQVTDRLNKAGFAVQFASYRLFLQLPLIFCYRLLTRLQSQTSGEQSTIESDISMPPGLINTILLGLVRIENRIMKVTPLPMGSSVFVIARKLSSPA